MMDEHVDVTVSCVEETAEDVIDVVFKRGLGNMHGAAFLTADRIACGAIGNGRGDDNILLLGKTAEKPLCDQRITAVGAMGAVVFHGTADENERGAFFLRVLYIARKCVIKQHTDLLYIE